MIIFINAAFRNAAIVSAILFFPSKAPARLSEWWFVAQGADRVLFVDAESIERDGDVASYWVSQVLREPGNPAALIRAFMRTDCIKRQQTWSVVTRYDAKDHRLDPSSASYAEPQQIVAGTLGEAELDFVCAANRADTAGFPLKIDEVAFADALIADTAGVVQPAELHDRLRENPATAVIRSTAAQPATFGTEQHVTAGQPIVPRGIMPKESACPLPRIITPMKPAGFTISPTSAFKTER
ncbi:hypothetical protein D3Y57_00675 (plasmid) [Sphingomonas paeninsulae]|uniref:Surface-adhesin protein E-like domain-containing protein n=1 Tax=Sphingomonas paeninsulae TaxID=2319844 RepID=A0A494TFN1_SPHPE|nr:surface-adhesin E family protein [Sphingomonas paeninsulae]AYJ84651.1 hypothetical protein D3Y57_00675 [Sphingomonas paeninsulae]